MNSPLLTIITPTYNRAHLLPNLYRSLLGQNETDYEWLIVDDGSNDDTKSVVSGFCEEGRIPITYVFKENGGKHTALNLAIRQVNTPLIMIVDSDDTLLENAVSVIRNYYEKYGDNRSIVCWSFLRCYSNGKPIVGLDSDEFMDNYIKYRIKGNRPGDMAEVFRSEVLKEYPFPEYPGEKFLSEDVVWIEIGKKYDTVYINKPIYQCEYLDGGLTSNDKPVKFASPKGSMLRGKRLMSRECGLKANIRGAIIYDCYRRECKSNTISYALTIREKILTAICYPVGIYYNSKWKASGDA